MIIIKNDARVKYIKSDGTTSEEMRYGYPSTREEMLKDMNKTPINVNIVVNMKDDSLWILVSEHKTIDVLIYKGSEQVYSSFTDEYIKIKGLNIKDNEYVLSIKNPLIKEEPDTFVRVSFQVKE